MITFYCVTKHPKTGRWENACWIDGHYGRYHYGVQLPNGDTFDPWVVTLRTEIDETEAEILNRASGAERG